MAVVYESVQTANSGTTSVTITKPVSLAVGDLMVAHIAASNQDGDVLDDFTLSGWTSIATAFVADAFKSHRGSAFYKIAVQADVDATDFTFTGDADCESMTGAIYRFSGAAAVSGAADSDDAGGTTFTNTLTPTFPDSMMLFLISGASNGGINFDSYAITNNNPTWTERYDIDNTAAAGDGDTSMAGATASRPETSATGDSTCSGNQTVASAIIVAIYPIVSVTVSPAVITALFAVQDPTVSGGAVVTPSVISMAASVQDPIVTVEAALWEKGTKNSTAWTYLDKP